MAEVFISGPAGQLEGRYHKPDDNATAPIALVLHPHPQHGGTMHNKVAYHVHRRLVEEGFAALSINFRGVGQSAGTYDHGQGEVDDARAGLDWLQQHHPEARDCWVAGFSFGSWVGLRLVTQRPEVSHMVAISPPASLYDFTFLDNHPLQALIVQGTADTVVDPASVAALAKRLGAQPGAMIVYDEIPEATHFFNDHMSMMTDCISRYTQAARD